MDSILHTTQGVLIAATIDALAGGTVPAGVYIAGALGGIAADAAGEAERVIKRDRSLWNWYTACHKWEAVWWMTIGMFAVAVMVSSGITVINATIAFAAAYALHLYLDSFSHAPGHRWWIWGERLWLEILMWLATVVFGLALWA